LEREGFVGINGSALIHLHIIGDALICAAFAARAILPNERLFDLTIRAAEMNDAAALAQLMCELGYETTKSEMQMRLSDRYR
jgi:hypothetical protein